MRYLIRTCSAAVLSCILAVMCCSAFAVEEAEPVPETTEQQQTISSETNTEEVVVPPVTPKKYKVVDIDLGEFQSEMAVGSSQMITPTAIYVESEKYDELLALYTKGTKKALSTTNEAEYQLFLNWLFKPERTIQPYYSDLKTSELFIRSFSSRNTSIAMVNAMGRVYAIAPGKVKIQIRCGNYTKSVLVTVSPKTAETSVLPTDQTVDYSGGSDFPSGDASSEETTIAVRDLDFGDYEKKLEVGKSVALSVSVIPSNATNGEVSYSSSDESIATVNGLGRVTAVSAGQVRITAKAGGVRRSISLEVEVKTDGIEIDNAYIVLKPEEEHTISANVVPEDAPQELTYTSSDESVATVSDEGVVKAIAPGSTSVVVSNGSAKSVVSIIVNQKEDPSQEIGETVDEEPEQKKPPLLDEIISGQDGQEFVVSGEILPIITTEYLRALYGTNKTLTVNQNGYAISVCGDDIVNIENEIITVLDFIHTDKGIQFTPNNSKQLPGKIKIKVDNIDNSYKWLYLYNESLGKWQQLSSYDDGIIVIDTEGKYCLRQHKEPLLPINWWIVLACTAVVIAGIGVYIATRKKYWFW